MASPSKFAHIVVPDAAFRGNDRLVRKGVRSEGAIPQPGPRLPHLRRRAPSLRLRQPVGHSTRRAGVPQSGWTPGSITWHTPTRACGICSIPIRASSGQASCLTGRYATARRCPCITKTRTANRIEFQVDCFATAEEANAYMRSDAFAANPIGVQFDPDDLVEQFRKGVPESQLLARPDMPGAPIPREHGMGA